jgi:hypothetical protein
MGGARSQPERPHADVPFWSVSVCVCYRSGFFDRDGLRDSGGCLFPELDF